MPALSRRDLLALLLAAPAADANLGRLEYPIQMVKQCGLVWQDIFVPKPASQKHIQVKK